MGGRDGANFRPSLKVGKFIVYRQSPTTAFAVVVLFPNLNLKFSTATRTDGCVLPYSVGKSEYRFTLWAFFVNMGFIVLAFIIKFGSIFEKTHFFTEKSVFFTPCL